MGFRFTRFGTRAVGSPERASEAGRPDSIPPEDPHKGTVSFLATDAKRLPKRADILEELNILNDTRDLNPAMREELANRIMDARDKAAQQQD